MNIRTTIWALSLALLLPTSAVSAPSPFGEGCGEASPMTFWYWMYGAVSKAGIHADLCGMKDIGLGGCYLMPIRSSKEKPEYNGKADQLTPEFWSMVDYAFQQADSLGLQMGIHVCDGFALAGFPTITPRESMQKIVWSDTIVTEKQYKKYIKSGKDIKDFPVRQPESYEGYYEDIATVALPCDEIPRQWKPDSVTLYNISTNKGYWLASKPASITYSFQKPVTVRSMYIEPEGNNVQSERLLVEASDDGITYYKVRQLVPPRQGWQNTSCGYTYSLPETTARFFRFSWKAQGTEPGSEDLDAAKWKALLKLRNITLSNEQRIDNYEGKAGYVWRIATGDSCFYSSSNPYSPTIKTNKTTKASPYYRILRIGHTSTGQMNATAGGGKGLEVDKFSRPATMKLLNGWFLNFLKRPHSSVVKYLHVDSWECGSQNWGENFAEEFKTRRGYDLLPYLPVMCGFPMESEAKTEQVLRDVRLTINDLVNDVFFATVAETGHSHGMLVSHESIAPTFPADGIEHYKSSDIPMGEFWLNSSTHDKPNDMLDAVSGAHAYGKNIVQAEGFTEVRGTWDETPAMIKPLLDRNFCLGMNRLFFHVNAHNPWMDRHPGMTLDGIGLFFQRDNTWYRESKGLVDYITRCQTELQKGTPVVDIAVYTGEDIPSRALTPDRLMPMLPGLFGEERVEAEMNRLANEGQPMEESPVGVTHSANIFSLDGWSNALHGYKYDCINRDALLSTQTSILNPQTSNPKVLVLPQYYAPGVKAKPLSDEVKARIDELRKQGVVVISEPYFQGTLSEFGIQPDIYLPENMDYYHRHTDSCEIYFISNQQAAGRDIIVAFRETYKYAAYMNPVDGQKYSLEVLPVSGGMTATKLYLQPNGALIVWLSNSTFNDSKVKQQRIETEGGQWLDSEVYFDNLDKRLEGGANQPPQLDWTKSDDNHIANYSGSATFTAHVAVKEKFDGCTLDLGDVRDVAHVYVNGIDCGIAWTAPYEVDITKALHQGDNEIRMVVTNTWHNALMAADDGNAPFPGIWTNAKYRTKSKDLLPAGLLTPVKLKFW